MIKRPNLPYVLGIAGLVPFVFFAVAIPLELGFGPMMNILALLWYAAIILSFLGGTRWGAEIATNPDNPSKTVLSLAMLPSITAWLALVLIERGGFFLFPDALFCFSDAIGIGALIIAFALMLIWDLHAIRNGIFPKWYAVLRVGLTVIAIASFGWLIALAPFTIIVGVCD